MKLTNCSSLPTLIILLFESGKIVTTNEFGSNKKQIGSVEGGTSLAEMVAILSRFSLF